MPRSGFAWKLPGCSKTNITRKNIFYVYTNQVGIAREVEIAGLDLYSNITGFTYMN